MRVVRAGIDDEAASGEVKGEEEAANELRMVNEKQSYRSYGGWLPGTILILMGTLILLDHMNVLHGERLWKFWPVLIMIVGVAKIVNEGKRVGGVLLILVGGFLLAEHLGYTTWTWSSVWPVILIAAGIAMIWGRFDVPRIRPAATGDGRESIQAFALFGGVERRVTVNNFRQGTVSAILGGVELDFRSADIEGEEAILYVEAIMGGIEVSVPERWHVVFEGESIFGGYSDETRTPVVDAMGTTPKKYLILRGRAVFGGIVVKN
jgi:predicted membrane protein